MEAYMTLKRVFYILLVLVFGAAAAFLGAVADGVTVYRLVRQRSSLPQPIQQRYGNITATTDKNTTGKKVLML